MKHPILLLSFLLLSFVSSGQDYNPLSPGTIRYFINGDGYLRGMRIDSIIPAGSDLLYYPFHTPRGDYQMQTAPLDINGGSWFGKQIIGTQDGTFLFDNLWHDTIVIRTQANVGDNWVFYNDTSSVFYTATVTTLDTMTILGNLDSVKTILINAYQNTQLLTNDPANDLTIQIGKATGFIKAIDLHTFPYHKPGQTFQYQAGFDYYLDIITSINTGPQKLTFQLVEFHSPTQYELYDFQPGELFGFHFYGMYGEQRWWRDSIISRTQIGSNTVQYTIQRDKKVLTVQSWPWVTTYTSQIVTPSYGTYEMIDMAKVPEETGAPNIIYYCPWDSSKCFQSKRYMVSTNFVSYNGWVNTFEPCGQSYGLKVGFGLIGESICLDPTPGNSESWDLTHSTKNGIPCGYMASPMSVGVAELETALEVFPNPANETLSVLNPAKEQLQVTLTDLYGQTVRTVHDDNEAISIRTLELPSGIYTLKVTGKNGAIRTASVLIKH